MADETRVKYKLNPLQVLKDILKKYEAKPQQNIPHDITKKKIFDNLNKETLLSNNLNKWDEYRWSLIIVALTSPGKRNLVKWQPSSDRSMFTFISETSVYKQIAAINSNITAITFDPRYWVSINF